MNWWEYFGWGIATDICEDDDDDEKEELSVDIKITIED